MDRDQIQKEAQKLGVAHPRLIVQWPTGSGKGKACMMILDKAPTTLKWLVLVPELIQIENLKRDIEKHGFQHLYDKIEAIECYASFKKYKGRKLNLWLNECQRLSELREDIAQTVECERIVADSATIPYDVKERLIMLGNFSEYKITLSDAIEGGLLPRPSIHVVYMDLDNVVKRNEYKGRKLTDRQFYDILENQIDYWKGRVDNEPWAANRLNAIGSQRKKFLAECKSPVVRDILLKLGPKRTLCYVGSVDQCNELGGPYAVNSKKTKQHNLKVLERFNNMEIDRIFMNRMGREGLNLEGIRAVIITQLSSGRDEGLEFIQSTGRALRSDKPEIYLVICKNTMDENYLARALQVLDQKKVKIEYSEFGETQDFL